MYTFDFAKDPNCKGLNFMTAQGLWGLFFAEKYPGVQKMWDEFLNVRGINLFLKFWVFFINRRV